MEFRRPEQQHLYNLLSTLNYHVTPLHLMVKIFPAMQETWVQSLDGEDTLRTEWQPTPVFLPGASHGRRNLVGYSSWGCKELDTTERLSTYLHVGG